MEINDHLTAQAWLQNEFCARRRKNPSYSLRRMAQQLEVPSGRLSEILNGRRGLTAAMAKKIAERLAYSPEQRARFLKTVGRRTEAPAVEPAYHELNEDAFHVLADWYHFAVLSLLDIKGFTPTPKSIATRLGISPTEARLSLDRLERLGLIRKDGTRIVKTAKNVTTTHDVESAALKISHRQNLELAIAALEETRVDRRDITSITMAIDERKLPLAKAMIKKFRRQLCEFLESDNQNEVFNLNIQLFPLTKVKK